MANNDSVSKHPIDELVAELSQDPDDYIVYNLRYLLQAGADVDKLVARMEPKHINRYLEQLIKAGADVDKLVAMMEPECVCWNYEKLCKAGANIDVDRLVNNLEVNDFYFFIDDLLEAGADANKLVARLNPVDIVYNITKLRKAGADIDVNALLTKLEPVDIAFNLTALNEAGANINGDKLFASLEPQDIIRRFRDRRPDTGADADRLVARVNDSWVYSGTRRSCLSRWTASSARSPRH